MVDHVVIIVQKRLYFLLLLGTVLLCGHNKETGRILQYFRVIETKVKIRVGWDLKLRSTPKMKLLTMPRTVEPYVHRPLERMDRKNI